MDRAIGISVHTGWAACVVAAGTLRAPEIVANEIIEIVEDPERFCFHAVADMKRAAAERFLERLRARALTNARRALAPLLAQQVTRCAIVAKDGEVGDLDAVLASHTRIHTAEGFFYRDVFREACPGAVQLVPPAALDVGQVGRIARAPWGRDQKLAALAAWKVLGPGSAAQRTPTPV